MACGKAIVNGILPEHSNPVSDSVYGYRSALTVDGTREEGGAAIVDLHL